MMRLTPLQEKTRELTLSLPQEDREKMVTHKPGEPQQNPTMPVPLTWTFQPPELSNKRLSFKPPDKTNTVSFLIPRSKTIYKGWNDCPRGCFHSEGTTGKHLVKDLLLGSLGSILNFLSTIEVLVHSQGILRSCQPLPGPPEPGLHTWTAFFASSSPFPWSPDGRPEDVGGRSPGTAGKELILSFF